MSQRNKKLSTVKEYIRRHGEADLLRTIEINSPPDSDKFIERLYSEIASIVRTIEGTASIRKDDNEDRITLEIIQLLNQTGYNATHDTYTKGHVDIRISSNSFVWLGEAKIHNDYEWLLDGMKQLHTRYSTGREDGLGLMIYIRNRDAKAVIDEWRKRLEENKYCGLKESKDGQEKLTFRTVHQHAGSGLDIETKHIGVSLFYNPEK